MYVQPGKLALESPKETVPLLPSDASKQQVSISPSDGARRTAGTVETAATGTTPTGTAPTGTTLPTTGTAPTGTTATGTAPTGTTATGTAPTGTAPTGTTPTGTTPTGTAPTGTTATGTTATGTAPTITAQTGTASTITARIAETTVTAGTSGIAVTTGTTTGIAAALATGTTIGTASALAAGTTGTAAAISAGTTALAALASAPKLDCICGDFNLDSSYSLWGDWTYNNPCPTVTDYKANDDAFSTIRTRTRTYNKTKEELLGCKCPQPSTNYTKQIENYTCPRDCFGEWKITRPCNTSCPGNAVNNNGISTKTSSGGQATQTRTFSIIKPKLGLGQKCSPDLDRISEEQTCDTSVECICTVERDYKPWEFTNPKCDPSAPFTADNKFRNITITKKTGSSACTFPKINPNEKALNPYNENTSDELQFVSDNNVIQTIETENNIKSSVNVFCIDYMVPGNIAANMNTTNGTELTKIRDTDVGSTSIGTIGFPFYFFGVDYGTNSTIYWSTRQVLLFGTSDNFTTSKRISLGHDYRRTKTAFRRFILYLEIHLTF
jgi:hypothetical protein